METLASLFPLDPERLQRQLQEQVLAGNAWLAGCGREVTREVGAAMAQRLPDALDQRLDDLVAAAFRSRPTPPLEAHQRVGPAEIALPLQRLQSSHRPRLQVQLGDRPLLEAVFEVSLELLLSDVGLRLQDGRPVALRTGPANVSGILLLGRQMLARVSGQPLRLPAVLPLERVRERPPA